MALGSLPTLRGLAAEGWTLANSLRSLTNPDHASFAEGGEMMAQSVGLPYEMLVTERNSEKVIADGRALLARTGGKLALCIDPNGSPGARVILDECKNAGAFVVTIWNKPDLLPTRITTRTKWHRSASTACRTASSWPRR